MNSGSNGHIKTPQSLVIYGNSVESWAIAAGLSRVLTKQIREDLISISIVSSEIPEAGPRAILGSPNNREFFKLLGLTESDILENTNSAFSLGFSYEYCDDNNINVSKHYCFGDNGYALKGTAFHHIWSKYCNENKPVAYDLFSLAARCANKNKFIHPNKNANPLIASLDYAINFDSFTLAKLFKTVALKNGVVQYCSSVSCVKIFDASRGINAILLENGHIINGDLFIDTSIEQTLQKSINNSQSGLSLHGYRMEMPISQSASKCTLTKIRSGWVRETPLRNIKIVDFTPAIKTMPLTDVKCLLEKKYKIKGDSELHSTFQVRHAHSVFWKHNVLSMGASTYPYLDFIVSPLDLIYKQICVVSELLPQEYDDMVRCAEEYNRRLKSDFNRTQYIQDLHHYIFNKETLDSSGAFTDKISHMLQLFRDSGIIANEETGTLDKKDWAKLLICLGITPKAHDPLLDACDFEIHRQQIDNGLKLLDLLENKLPSIDVYMKLANAGNSSTLI